MDEYFPSRKDCCKVEQACQYKIDHLELGTQRLHRVPGAGIPHLNGDGGRMKVGATYLPPDFFKNNPDIVIMGRYDNRHAGVTDTIDSSSSKAGNKSSSQDS
jgi:hypothetical protein